MSTDLVLAIYDAVSGSSTGAAQIYNLDDGTLVYAQPDGTFIVPNLADGVHHFLVRWPGRYQDQQVAVVTSSSQPNQFAYEFVPLAPIGGSVATPISGPPNQPAPPPVPAPQLSRVAVKVIDTSGNPIAGAGITIDGQAAYATDADGVMAPVNATPGQHVVRAAAAGHIAGQATVTAVQGQTVYVTLTLQVSGASAPLIPAGTAPTPGGGGGTPGPGPIPKPAGGSNWLLYALAAGAIGFAAFGPGGFLAAEEI